MEPRHHSSRLLSAAISMFSMKPKPWDKSARTCNRAQHPQHATCRVATRCVVVCLVSHADEDNISPGCCFLQLGELKHSGRRLLGFTKSITTTARDAASLFSNDLFRSQHSLHVKAWDTKRIPFLEPTCSQDGNLTDAEFLQNLYPT